jgi:hypothetical protein
MLMFENKKIVVVTPAGRKKYLELLIPYVLKLRDVVDEYRLWVNTDDKDDIDYMKFISEQYPDFIKLEYLSITYERTMSIYSFFKNCTDKDTVYVRFDDDIVMMDDITHFKNFLKFRIENPQYFVVYANILNNSVISHLHQRFGKLNTKIGLVDYNCTCNLGWRDPKFVEDLHRQVLEKNDLSFFHFNNPWILHFYERVSINCLSWLGEEFNEFDGLVGRDEEKWISCDKPLELGKPSVIYGEFSVVHYAFGLQRDYLDTTDIYSKYKAKII